MYEAAFRDLRRLADWFSTGSHESLGRGVEIDLLVRRLGATAIPLLCRELCIGDPWRRDAARDALGALAVCDAIARARVTNELHAITEGTAADDAKVVAMGLLSELGESAEVRFADPTAIRTRSAIALAAHLETAADVASAADLMVHQLDADDIVQMLEVVASAAPRAAHRLATELTVRLDITGDLRDRAALIAATISTGAMLSDEPGPDASEHLHGRTHAAVLVDAARRRVVIASRRVAGEPRWRRWAVLIGACGRIEDCLHEDDAGRYGDTASLSAELCADGYRVASTDREQAREVVAAAARVTVTAPTATARALPSAYYLGRDLLGLGDAHLAGRSRDPAACALGRALALIAEGDHTAALALLDRCDPDHPDAAAARAVALLAQNRLAAAVAALDRAIAAEPDWPLHHWNLAAALRRAGDDRGCHGALQRFVATSALPSALIGDPDQAARLASAERMIAELERTASRTPDPRPRAAPVAMTPTPAPPRGPHTSPRGKRKKRGSG